MKKIQRRLNLSSAIAIGIAGMIGSGIFVLPGIAVANTGSSVWLAYLCAAVCILPAVLSKSELATSMPNNGGTYVYIERAFGPLFGTISGIGLWLSLLLKSSFALVGFSAYLSIIIEINFPPEYLSILFLALIMLLNISGAKKVANVQLVIVIISLLGLGSILVIGTPNFDTSLMQPFFLNGKMGFITTVAIVYMSYAGVTKLAAIGGEVKNPSKNIPKAMIYTLLIITLLYVSITLILVGNIPIEEIENNISPIFTIANSLGGTYFGYAAAILGAITLISMANSGVLTASPFPFAMARDNLFPSLMGKIHPKYLTPISSIIATCIIMASVILILDVERIVKLASAFKVMMFIAVNSCVIVFRETSAQWYKPKYKSPLYPYIQIFGILSGLVLLFFLGFMSILSITGVAIIGSLIYFFYGKKTSRSGILQRYGQRTLHFLLHGKKTNYNELKTEFEESKETDIDDYLVSNAGVVIPLLGNEYSPEMLIEIGASLNEQESAQAIHITEVPNQTILDAINIENPKISSLKRKTSLIEKTKKTKINFECLVTHNLSNTIQGLSNQTHCDWLVLGWNGREHNGILVNNPIGWLVANVNSNFALYKDNGDRNINKILLALRPGKINEKYIKAVSKISHFYNASFTLLHVLSNNESEKEERVIRKESQNMLKTHTNKPNFILERSNKPIKMVSSIAAGYDLLVVGTPKKENFISILFGRGKDDFVENAPCSVLRLTIKK